MAKLINQGNKHIVVATWNANGLARGKAELEVFLEEKNVAILMVSETRLKPTRALEMKGFRIFRKDRLTMGGGSSPFGKTRLSS